MTEYGLILAGGGAKGSYQLGVWRALREMNIKITAVAGTSVGAINGAMVAQGDFDTACEVWGNIDYNVIFNFTLFDAEERAKMSFQERVDYVKALIKKRGLDTHSLRTLLNAHIDEKKIRKSHIYYGLVTFSLTDMEPVIKYIDDIPEGKLIDYIMASAAFPLFQDHILDDKLYVDGGVYDNVPISVLADKGFKNLIVVDLSAIGRVKKVDTTGLNIVNIKTSQIPGGVMQFEKELVPANLKVGYLDTLKAFGKVKGIRYYLSYNENQFTDLCEIPTPEEYLQWMVDMDMVNRHGKPDGVIIYRILRRMRTYTDMNLTDTSGFIAALEITAEILQVDRFKVYTLKTLTEAILERYKEIRDDSTDTSPIKEITDILWNKKEVSYRDEEEADNINPMTSIIMNKVGAGKQKLLSVGYPDLCIANLFIYMLLGRIKKRFGDDKI